MSSPGAYGSPWSRAAWCTKHEVARRLAFAPGRLLVAETGGLLQGRRAARSRAEQPRSRCRRRAPRGAAAQIRESALHRLRQAIRADDVAAAFPRARAGELVRQALSRPENI